jgi:hypothetical protein
MTSTDRTTYLALSVSDVVEMDYDLEALLRRLRENWREIGEDMVIWLEVDAWDGRPRLVGLVRTGPDGLPAVRWV